MLERYEEALVHAGAAQPAWWPQPADVGLPRSLAQTHDLLPVHPLTAASARAVVPGQVTRYDIEVFPTFAEIPAGWRLRVTLTTSDTPHLVPTAAQLPDLVGGVYQVQRNSTAASYINVPLAPAGAFSIPCGALCSATGP